MVKVRPEVVGAVIQIIDESAKKGVFSGADLTTVGNIRQQLVEAINEAMPKPEAKEQPQAPNVKPSEK